MGWCRSAMGAVGLAQGFYWMLNKCNLMLQCITVRQGGLLTIGMWDDWVIHFNFGWQQMMMLVWNLHEQMTANLNLMVSPYLVMKTRV